MSLIERKLTGPDAPWRKRPMWQNVALAIAGAILAYAFLSSGRDNRQGPGASTTAGATRTVSWPAAPGDPHEVMFLMAPNLSDNGRSLVIGGMLNAPDGSVVVWQVDDAVMSDLSATGGFTIDGTTEVADGQYAATVAIEKSARFPLRVWVGFNAAGQPQTTLDLYGPKFERLRGPEVRHVGESMGNQAEFEAHVAAP